MNFNDFNIVIDIIEIIAYSFFYTSFFSCKRKNKMIYGIFLGFSLLVSTLLFKNSDPHWSGYISLVHVFIALVFICFCGKVDLFSALLISLFPDLITALINANLMITVSHFTLHKIDYMELMAHYEVPIIISSKLLQIVIFIILCKYIKTIIASLSQKEKFITSITILLNIVIIDTVELNLYQGIQLSAELLCNIVIAVGLLSVLIFVNISSMSKRKEEENLHKLEKQLLEIEISNIKASVSTETELHQLKHDVQHLLSSLPDNSKKSPEAMKLLERMTDIVIPLNSMSETLNTIINIKRNQAKSKGITTNCLLNISHQPVLSDDDIYLLFVNLLDNAIEHCGSDNLINIDIKSDTSNLLVKIANSIDRKVIDKDGKIINQPKPGHGYGLKTINAIVKKYSGEITLEEIDHMFVVTILIPNNKLH